MTQTSKTCKRNKQLFILHLFARIKRQEGQALIEAAISLPILALLLLGSAEFATLAYTSIEVSNAAMAGVQYGAQSATTAADTTGIQNAASNDASDISLGTTTATVSCICSNGSASTCLRTDCSSSNIEEILTVKTQASFTPQIHVPGLSTTFALKGQAVQKVLQ